MNPVTKLTRRSFLATTAAAATALPLASCSGALGSGNVLTVGAVNFKARNSVDATTGRPVSGLRSITGSFESGLPDLRIEYIDINGSSSNAVIAKIQTLLMSKAIDVVQGNTLWPYYEQNLIANLNPYFAKDHWADNYIPSILAPPVERFMYPPFAEKPTVHLSAPGDMSTFSLAFDSQLFDDFGVEPLAKIPTIEEILEKSPRLTGKNPRTGRECFGLSYDPRSQAHIMLYYLGRGIDLGKVDAANPSALTLDTPQVRRGIEGMIKLGAYAPPGFEIGQGLENWGTDTNTVAINMIVQTATMQKAVDNKLAQRYVVTEGVRDKYNHTFLITGSEWAIAESAPDKDLAWEMVKFLSGPAGQKLAFANNLALPSWKNADWVDLTRQPYAPPFLAAATAAKNAFFPQFMFTTFRPWIAKVVSLALNGEKLDLAAGLADMQRKGEQWVVDSTRPKPPR